MKIPRLPDLCRCPAPGPVDPRDGAVYDFAIIEDGDC